MTGFFMWESNPSGASRNQSINALFGLFPRNSCLLLLTGAGIWRKWRGIGSVGAYTEVRPLMIFGRGLLGMICGWR